MRGERSLGSARGKEGKGKEEIEFRVGMQRFCELVLGGK